MATKWKRSKAILGFLAFALGVNLTLTSALPLLNTALTSSGRQRLQELGTEDFRETANFRSYIGEQVNLLLTMAAGGNINGSFYFEQGTAYSDILIQTAVIEDVPWEMEPDAYSPTQAEKDAWQKWAASQHEAMKKDQNLLYRIEYEGKLLYTNADTDLSVAPEGYGFFLTFDGEKCTAVKDGRPVDLYKDGVYTDDGSHWYLPGYQNFPAGEEASKARIALAVTDTPALYITGNYSTTGPQWQGNSLYYMVQNQQVRRQQYALWGAGLLGGLVCLALYVLLRKGKVAADHAIAKVSGHIWFEIKVIIALTAVGVMVFLPINDNLRSIAYEFAYLLKEENFYDTYLYSSLLEDYLREILRSPVSLLIGFWGCYLLVNDLRRNPKTWQHGIAGMLTARGLKLPIQKRLSRRYSLLGLGIILLGAELISLLILQTLRAFLPRWAIWNLFLLPLLLVLGGYLWSLRGQRRLAEDLGLLADQITAVRNGDYTASPLPDDSDLGRASREVADIQRGMEKAVEEQTRSERMKVELVTNVSHDLKTPLTSIISYAELLEQEHLDPPAGEYVTILGQKAERLRAMVSDVFEVSKATSGNLPVKPEKLDLAKLLRQTLADMAGTIEAAPVTLRETIPEGPVEITADGDRLYRVFQNLLQNALQYSLEGSRVYLDLAINEGKAVVAVKNTSKIELPEGVDFTARFVRGDGSRTDGGSGLGLAIADSFTAACGGELKVEPVADLFVVKVSFPLT